MSKTLTSANSNVLDDSVIVPVHFIKIEYTSGTLYLNTSERDITFDSNSYVGGYGVANISSIEESQELQASGIQLTVSGVSSSNVSIALTENFKNVDATLYLGFLDTTNYTLKDDPFIIFKGKVDTQNLELSGETATIVIEMRTDRDWET